MNEQILSLLKQIDNKIDKIQSSKKWLSVKELSDYIGLSPSKIRQLVKEDRIPYNRIDGSYRFNTNKIDLWLQSNASKTSFTKRDRAKLEILK